MWLAVVGGHAWASTWSPPAAVIRSADAVFLGTVVARNECVSADGDGVWTFTQFAVTTAYSGTLVPAQGEPANRFTVRQRGGTWPNGDRSGVMGTPNFEVGEQAFVALTYGSDELPDALPLSNAGDSVWRVVPLADGSTTVVDGAGRLVLRNKAGDMVLGPQLDNALSTFPARRDFDHVALRTPIKAWKDAAWNEAGIAEGPWKARVRFELTDPVEITWNGVSTVPDADGTCNATLQGEVVGGSLTLSGSCNVPYVGAVDVVVQGTMNGAGTWVGLLTATPRVDPGLDVYVTWTDQAWSGSLNFGDLFVAAGTGSAVVGIPEELQDNIEVVDPIHTGLRMRATYIGRHRPMTRSELGVWIDFVLDAQGSTGGTVRSLLPTPANCPTGAIAAVAGGAQ